ncbi:hypothetical protein RI129_008969 [Pyrocoelia pectoralis]|uniref:Uncharacterized protein n=1 Tax=Pyrocoelia pectoralis TaxID=417401 RepID=A0AAN7ZHY1_9COLE
MYSNMKFLILLFCIPALVVGLSSKKGGGGEIAKPPSHTIELTDLVIDILKCLLESVKEILSEDVPILIKELKEALVRINLCTHIKIIDHSRLELIELLKCAISSLGKVSSEDLTKIVKQLDPILKKVTEGLSCIEHVLKSICSGGICVLSILGISCSSLSLLAIVDKLLDGVLQLLCNLLGTKTV